MADEHLTEGSDWVEEIFQVSLDTKWKGGADGTANMQAQALASRTRYLKIIIDELKAGNKPLAAILSSFAELPGEADKIPYFTGADTLALATLTAFCRTVLESNSADGFRSAIGAASIDDIAHAVETLVGSSPKTLDTINELASALGNDPNFATSITTLIGQKAPLSSPFFTDEPKAPIPADNDNSQRISTTSWLWKNIKSLVNSCISAVATEAGFVCSLGTNGYIRCPNWLSGLMVQWGTLAYTSAGTQTVSLPTSFTSQIYWCIGYVSDICTQDNQSNSAGKNGASLSTILVYTDVNVGTSWITIGK